MIPKKMFVETIENILKEAEKARKFAKALDIYADGHFIWDADNLYLKSLMDILEHIFHDNYDTISWFIWEDVEKKIWLADGTEIDVSTPEKLYDYLIDCMTEDGVDVEIVSDKESVADSGPITEVKPVKEDRRPRYLIIADKPLYANELKKAYESLGSNIQYDADFAWLNCLVVNIESPWNFTDINGDDIDIVEGGIYPDHFGNQLIVEPLILPGWDFSDKYRVIHGGDYNKTADSKILKLLAQNEYDAIINATDCTNEGNLGFEWMIESLGLEDYEFETLAMFYHESDSFKEELLKLNNLKAKYEEILNILM